MSSQGISDCCVTGHLHEGGPTGAVTEIVGLKTYIAEPEGGSKDKSVIFITDIFGYQLPNVQLLADEYAKAGFYVYVPDFFDGDPVPESIMQKLIPTKQQAAEKTLVDKATDTASVGATMGPWLVKHREAVSLPLIQKFVSHIRSTTSPSKLGAVGFCWGGRYVILLAHEGADPYIDAGVANHPSFLSMPSEIEKIARPVDIEVGDSDDIMKMPDVEKTKEIFKTKEGCEIEVYEDQVHGFTVRGDLSVEKDKKAKENATERGINFLKKHLGSPSGGK